MKTSRLVWVLTLLGLAALLTGCASLRPAPVWVCGNMIILEEEPASAPSLPAASPSGDQQR